MGMTMTQKILAAHAGLEKVEAGQLIEANLDLVLGNDVTAPVAIKEMEKMILQVPVEDIIPNRFQPRLSFDDTSLNDLALSIKQHGSAIHKVFNYSFIVFTKFF